VNCANCGRAFEVIGRADGFSHCDNHAEHQPLPEEGFTIVISGYTGALG